MLTLYIIGAVIVFIGISAFFGAPYVPSHRSDVRALLDALGISEADTLLDIGSGDGVVLREASRRGATAIGYEIHPFFVGIARLLSWRDPRVTVRWANAWTTPFPENVTLVYAFGVGRDTARFIQKLQTEATRLGRAIPFVSYGNTLRGKTPVRQVGAYFLYQFEPLHQQ